MLKEQKFMITDLSGRGYTVKLPKNRIIATISNNVATSEELEEIRDYLNGAESGDEYISTSFKLIAL
jgi:hypothetical protein